MPKAKKKDKSTCPLCGTECVPTNDGVKWCDVCQEAVTQLCAGVLSTLRDHNNKLSPGEIVVAAVEVRAAAVLASRLAEDD